MKATLVKIEVNTEGTYILKVMGVDLGFEDFRLGEVELSQKTRQTRLGE